MGFCVSKTSCYGLGVIAIFSVWVILGCYKIGGLAVVGWGSSGCSRWGAEA